MPDFGVAAVDDGSVAMRGAIDIMRAASDIPFLGLCPRHEHIPQVEQWADRFVLLADPFMDDGLPLAAISALPSRVAVLVMTACTEPAAIRQALQAGARGFVGKDVDVSTLLAAVGAVGVGGMYLATPAQEILVRPALDGGR